MSSLILQKRKFAIKKQYHNLITRVQITVLKSSIKNLKVERITCHERAKNLLSRKKLSRQLIPTTVSSLKVLNQCISICRLRPRLHYTVFIRRRYGNVPFWPTVYTVPFSYPASNEECCIRKYLSVYTMPSS